MSDLLVQGDARRIPLSDGSVHCCVTSPPYYSLRDYGTGRWEGGDAGCDHLMPAGGTRNMGRDRAASGGMFHDSPIANQIARQYGAACGKCGARRVDRQLGLEESPDAYVAALVGVFREVRRVLRDDGTCWLNVGDSYATNPGNGRGGEGNGLTKGGKAPHRSGSDKSGCGLKPKDLIGVPWMLAFALRADGWYLRSEIIWAKPNPMPESVEDRPTKAHEQIFLLAKRERYYYDAAAVAEPGVAYGRGVANYPAGGWKGRDGDGTNDRRTAIAHDFVYQPTRNRRSVWTYASTPFNGAHFAVMPPALVEPCILAGSSAAGCCPACGAPWRRVVAKETCSPAYRPTNNPIRRLAASDAGQGTNGTGASTLGMVSKTSGLDWEPSCSCAAGPPVPALILDPFGGAATTAVVANALGRRAVCVELNPAYLALARRRLDRPHAPPVRATNGHAGPELPLFAGLGPEEE